MENKIAHHINATPEDFAGNGGIGRYVFLAGAEGRAKEIAERFTNTRVLPHSRANLYLGELHRDGRKLDVATISTGMGAPSAEIYITELLKLGAKRFLRIGTAGFLQPAFMSMGDILIASAAVRDESTGKRYLPPEIPAIASFELTQAARSAAKKLALPNKIHTGIVHSKCSFYGRQFAHGPQSEENQSYMNLLRNAGVLATEMETSILFLLAQLHNHQQKLQGNGPQHRVLAGAILALIGDGTEVGDETLIANTTRNTIDLALEAAWLCHTTHDKIQGEELIDA